MKRWLLLALWVSHYVRKSNTGELRLKLTDQIGLATKSYVEIGSEANH